MVYDPRQRIEYNNNLVEKGLLKTNTKRVKCYVSIDKQKERDNKMYNFNKQNVDAFVRRINKIDTGLTFSDLIPNNMTMRRPGSRVSLDNEFVVNSMEGSLIADHDI